MTFAYPERANNFDQLRLLGAILVIYGHSYALFARPVPMFAGNTVSTLGVKIFFCISGYLVACSWLRDPNFPRFIARRSLRSAYRNYSTHHVLAWSDSQSDDH